MKKVINKKATLYQYWPYIIVCVIICSLFVFYWRYQHEIFNQGRQPDEFTKVQDYISSKSALSLRFPEPLFVTEVTHDQDGLTRGDIVISFYPGGDESVSNLTIQYGIPNIDGKGGACGDGNGTYWKKERILSELIDVCEVDMSLHAGYPKNPKNEIEYSFFIGGKNITQKEFDVYKQVLHGGISFTNN